MSTEEKEKKTDNYYSSITKNLYLKLKNPLGAHINLESTNSIISSSEKKRKKELNRKISFSSFSNTTCSDILKVNNYLCIENNIILITINNYSYKIGLINKFDYNLQSLRLPQIEIIEPWKELGYDYPPYKNYNIIEESLYYIFSNIYKINLKKKDIFIPFSSINNMSDFSTIGDILFDTFQVENITFKEPSFVSSLIILEDILKENEGISYYKASHHKDVVTTPTGFCNSTSSILTNQIDNEMEYNKNTISSNNNSLKFVNDYLELEKSGLSVSKDRAKNEFTNNVSSSNNNISNSNNNISSSNNNIS
ncbi:actin-like protein, putative, partial [Hepatocystis sp. ex Piliocolobus tephrosceles]